MDLLIRILIALGGVWLTQTLLGVLEVKQPVNKAVMIIVVVLAVIFVLTGLTLGLR